MPLIYKQLAQPEGVAAQRKQTLYDIRLGCQEDQQYRYSIRRRRAPTFVPGDLVLVEREPVSTGPAAP